MTGIFKLNWKDLLRGLIVMLLAVLFSIPVEQIVDWIPFLDHPVIIMAISTIFGYLAKNLATDEQGKLGGRLQIK